MLKWKTLVENNNRSGNMFRQVKGNVCVRETKIVLKSLTNMFFFLKNEISFSNKIPTWLNPNVSDVA